MSYFNFLGLFLLVPIVILLGLAWWDRRRGRETVTSASLSASVSLRSWPLWSAIGLHVVIALLYTTPWDNYLVATRVWWYDPALVTGITLGWVPIEEYTFFVLQPILGGLWLGFLLRRLAPMTRSTLPEAAPNGLPITDYRLRVRSVILLGAVWLATAVILIINWQPGTYLALELVWALPPIMLQLGFGADILWQNRRIVFLTIAPLTLYLSAADALAINWGTWTIDPAQSLNIFLGGILPVEEFVFFLLTNTLVSFGIVLILAEASHRRLASFQNLTSLRRPVRFPSKGS